MYLRVFADSLGQGSAVGVALESDGEDERVFGDSHMSADHVQREQTRIRERARETEDVGQRRGEVPREPKLLARELAIDDVGDRVVDEIGNRGDVDVLYVDLDFEKVTADALVDFGSHANAQAVKLHGDLHSENRPGKVTAAYEVQADGGNQIDFARI